MSNFQWGMGGTGSTPSASCKALPGTYPEHLAPDGRANRKANAKVAGAGPHHRHLGSRVDGVRRARLGTASPPLCPYPLNQGPVGTTGPTCRASFPETGPLVASPPTPIRIRVQLAQLEHKLFFGIRLPRPATRTDNDEPILRQGFG